MTSAIPSPKVEVLLHDLWLRVHLRRFDGNDYPDGRPEYVSEHRAVDSFYSGVMKSQHIIEEVAREHGIDRVYDAPSARAAAPDALRVRIEALIDRCRGNYADDAGGGEPLRNYVLIEELSALLEDGAQ
jgi:hypothetical protein